MSRMMRSKVHRMSGELIAFIGLVCMAIGNVVLGGAILGSGAVLIVAGLMEDRKPRWSQTR